MIAFIWRESVYKNNFRCNKCGKRLKKDNSIEPEDDVLTVMRGGYMWGLCPRCMNPVFRTEPYYGDAKPGTLAGRWEGATED